jgi:predicted amidohydrolase
MTGTSNGTYRALALQAACQAVNDAPDRETAKDRMAASIERLGRQIRSSKAFIGPDCRLVVLPEYFLTGYPTTESVDEWIEKAAVSPDGPEYDSLAEVATDHDVFLAGNAYERDQHFPDLYFQTNFIIDPSGETVLRYRRLYSLYTPTPFDVWDRYREHYDLRDIFPVADTELGRLASVASAEILHPELVRCHAMRGAEVLVHPSSEAYSPRDTPRDLAKRARAFENSMYVISANTGSITNSTIPAGSTDGGSKVIDHKGRVLTEAGPGESMAAYAEVDLAALRRARRRPGIENVLADQRFDLVAESYADYEFFPPNLLEEGPVERERFVEAQQETIDRLIEEGVFR